MRKSKTTVKQISAIDFWVLSSIFRPSSHHINHSADQHPDHQDKHQKVERVKSADVNPIRIPPRPSEFNKCVGVNHTKAEKCPDRRASCVKDVLFHPRLTLEDSHKPVGMNHQDA